MYHTGILCFSGGIILWDHSETVECCHTSTCIYQEYGFKPLPEERKYKFKYKLSIKLSIN